MKYPYTRTQGTVTYTGGDGAECGREWFTLHRHARGRFVHAVCEMSEDGLLRDVSWSMGPDWRPIDGHVRVVLDGVIAGATSYSFNGNTVTCHAETATHGKMTQKRESDRPYEFLGLHPLICDGLLAAVRGTDAAGEKQTINSITCSYSQNGEKELIALPIEIGVTYCGEERLSVVAGEFDAHLFEVQWQPQWPPAKYWVWGEDYIFLKSTWEISELVCELTSLEVSPQDV